MELLATGLSGFVNDRMSVRSAHRSNWFATYVSMERRSGRAAPSIDDPAFLLRVMVENWKQVFQPPLERTERNLVSELWDARNDWAHNEPFSLDDAYRTLDSAQRLLAAVRAPEAEAVGRSKQALRQEQLVRDQAVQPVPADEPAGKTRNPSPPASEPVRSGVARLDRNQDDGQAADRLPRGISPRSGAGPVERAVRAKVRSGQVLETPARGRAFEVARVDQEEVVLLLGEKRARTRFTWPVLEGVIEFVQGRGWVEIGSSYDVGARSGTLDAYLKRHVNRATAGWVAALLEAAGVIEIDRRTPARVRLAASLASPTPPTTSRSDDAQMLADACRDLPPAATVYEYDDFITNLLLTVLDYQQHTTAVERAIAFFEDNRRDSVGSVAALKQVMAAFTDDEEGNRDLARALWGYELWTRAAQLRSLVRYFESIGVTSQQSLRSWAATADFSRDFEGRVKGLGPAVFNWLLMRLGIDTSKPDVRVRRFVEGVLGRPLPDEELVGLVAVAARLLGKSIREVDWAIWEHEGRSESSRSDEVGPTRVPAEVRGLNLSAPVDDVDVVRFRGDEEGTASGCRRTRADSS